MKACVGSTILSNSFDAGVDIVRNSTKGIKIPKLGLLFSSEKYNQDELLRGISTAELEMKVIGCTSSGAVMTPDGIISGDGGYAGMLVIEDNELTVGIAASNRGTDPRATGRRIAKEAMTDSGKKYPPVAFAMFATPGEEELYLKGIQDEIGELPMFGGSACDDNLVGEWKVLCDKTSYDDGCAVVLFYTNKDIKTVLNGTFEERDKMGIITKVDGDRRIVEIDNEPAMNKFAQWNDLNVEDLMGESLLHASLKNPLGMKTLQGEILAVRQPMIGQADLSFGVNAKIAEKTAIIQLSTDEDGMIGGAVETIRELNNDFKAGALLLVHSAYRKLCIGERIDEDFVAIKNAMGDTPFIVVFTSNEYGHANHSGAIINGSSLSLTGFSE